MGRGSSKISSGGKFANATDFENALSGFDDPRLQEYSNAYSEARSYTDTLKKNMEQSMSVDGYDEIRGVALKSELKLAQNTISGMPKMKTPAQLGELAAMNERVDVVKDLIKKNNKLKPGDTGTPEEVSIIV